MSLKHFSQFILILFILNLVTACGGGGGDSSSPPPKPNPTPVPAEPVTYTAYFFDSEVYGLTYEVGGETYKTDVEGKFTAEENETVTFSIAGMILGQLTITEDEQTITPLDLFQTNNIQSPEVINTLVTLQALDNDHNPVNGINLIAFNNAVENNNVSLDSLNIADDNYLQNLEQLLNAVNDSSVPHIALPDSGDVIAHFQDTLTSLEAPNTMIGSWVERRSNDGEVQAVWTFISDTEVNGINYTNCDGDENFTVSQANQNCSKENMPTVGWELNGKTLTMDFGSGDTCKIKTFRKNRITASCKFYGSGEGWERTVLKKRVTSLSRQEVLSSRLTYSIVEFGATDYVNYQFVEDGTGIIFTSSGQNVGVLTWSFSNNKFVIATTMQSGESENIELNFIAHVNGSFLTINEAESTNKELFLIPQFQAGDSPLVDKNDGYIIDVANLTDPRGCQAIYAYDGFNHRIEQASEQTEVGCTMLDESELSSTVEYIGPAIRFTLGEETRVCWPISFDGANVVDDTFLDYSTTVACSSTENQKDEFDVQIWYQNVHGDNFTGVN